MEKARAFDRNGSFMRPFGAMDNWWSGQMRGYVVAATAFVLGFGVFNGAQAAPQMLGVIASSSPLTLHCEGNVCKTEISTICLQAERDTPEHHQAYTAHDHAAFTLVATDRNDKTVNVELPESTFVSMRGYTAVEVSINITDLRASGLEPRALSVEGDGLLVPVAVADDPNPIAPGEVEHVLAALKPAADEVFKKHGPEYEAIRLVNRVINETPRTGRMAKTDREQLWDNTFGESARESSGIGTHRAADIVGYCQYRTKQGRFFSVRRCLEQRLDGMLMDINTEYWRSVQPGS